MRARILLVRHGRSEANDAGLWQGHGDSPLAQTGEAQASALAARLADVRPDRIVASDLLRAQGTAQALGGADVIDPAWKEMNLGDWEGETFERVMERNPDMLTAIRDGEDIRFGHTGETIDEFERRVNGAFDRVADAMEEGQTVIVVTHGGAIDAVVARFLGRVGGRRAYPIATNTSLTEIVRGRRRGWRLRRFNDALHLDEAAGFLGQAADQGYGVVGLVRHGVTKANIEARVQGQSCWGLDPAGFEQAEAFAARYPQPDVVYSSPQQRALETARAIGAPIVTDERLMEISFGEWEGRYDDEIRDDPLVRRIWRDGEDLPRGHTGETFDDVKRRIEAFLADLEVEPGMRALAVSHGVAIRAAVASVLQRGFDIEGDIKGVWNTGVTHLALAGPDARMPGTMLVDFNVRPEV